MAAPKLIVFDLDYTLWPLMVEAHTTPPFRVKEGRVVDRYGHHVDIYPDAEPVLEKVKSDGIPMGAISKSDEPAITGELLQVMDWKKYFRYEEIHAGNKKMHFKGFHESSGVDYKDMLFFDDEGRNIRDVTKLGVTCILAKGGITMELLEEGLQRHAEKVAKLS